MSEVASRVVDSVSSNKMLRALSAIALEMENFHGNTSISYQNYDSRQEISQKLSLSKSNIRLKRKQIKVLKQNLRNACVVAKTVMSAKEKETTNLHNHINNARSDCIDLYCKNITNTEAIQSLSLKNEALLEKIKTLEEFIELGYIELQKMRNIPQENVPTVMKLKEIMLSCGQYYADYSNELDTRMLFEQKNRFLNNKIKILTTNLNGVIEEKRNLRHQNNKLMKENALLKKYLKETKQEPAENIHYAHEFQENQENVNYLKTEGLTSEDHGFDLTTHLSLVKNLLNNQDNMLKDLKTLSEKLLNFESTTNLS